MTSNRLEKQIQFIVEIDKLKHVFVVNPGGSSVSGVNMRWLDMDMQPSIEENPEDPVDYYTIEMIVNLEVTYT